MKILSLILLVGLLVGGAMPDLSNLPPLAYGEWSTPDGASSGVSVLRGKYVANYLICRGEVQKRPFSIYDSETRSLYLDNNATDGVIDSVIQDASDSYVWAGAPPCTSNL